MAKSAFDQVRNAEKRGNAEQNLNNPMNIKRTTTPKATNHPIKYRSIRASDKVVNEYQALQYITKDKTRSDIMQRVFDIAKQELLKSPDAKKIYEQKYNALKAIR